MFGRRRRSVGLRSSDGGQQPPQFRAVVRFSVFSPGSGSWRATNSGAFSSDAAYRDYLWSEERLGPRLHIFGQLAAPIYDQIAARHDFRVLVQHSDDLPEPWIGRLRDLATKHPSLHLVPVPGDTEARETVAQDLARDGRDGTVALLRVDDDDLLSVDFLDQLLPHVTPQHHGWVISLGLGYATRWGDNGLIDFRELLWPFGSLGQTYVGSYDSRTGVLDMPRMLSHRTVHRAIPSVVDSRSPAFVQVRHTGADTRVGADPEEAGRSLRSGMQKLPAIDDFDTLCGLFPTLRADAGRAQRERARRAARIAAEAAAGEGRTD